MRLQRDEPLDPVMSLDRLAGQLPLRLWIHLHVAGGEIRWDLTGRQGYESLRSALAAGELGPVSISLAEPLKPPMAA